LCAWIDRQVLGRFEGRPLAVDAVWSSAAHSFTCLIRGKSAMP
jgi:hypothetical protein